MIGKVVCVAKPHIWKVTPGKIYDLYYDTINFKGLQYRNNDIYIIDDDGNRFTFVGDMKSYSDYFISLEDFRDKKLNELGIE